MQIGMLPIDDRASLAFSYIDFTVLLFFYQGEN